jgi:hypothetical protein
MTYEERSYSATRTELKHTTYVKKKKPDRDNRRGEAHAEAPTSKQIKRSCHSNNVLINKAVATATIDTQVKQAHIPSIRLSPSPKTGEEQK